MGEFLHHEAFFLYAYPWNDGPAVKTEHKGAQALVESADKASKSGDYKEIRGTDLMDLMVLHMKAREYYDPHWNVLFPN